MSFELRSPDGKTYPLHNDWMRLGRAKDNDIVFNDPAVSRYHLNFYLKDGGLIVEDAGSQNGFLVNGALAPDAIALNSGDRVSIGQLQFLIAKSNGLSNADVRAEAKAAAPGPMLSTKAFKLNRKQQSSAVAIVIIIICVLVFSRSSGPRRDPASAKEFAPVKPLNPEGYGQEGFRQKSITEVQSEAKFREAMRDYNNQNFSRALLGFQESLTMNPAHDNANFYIKETGEKITAELDELFKDSQRSFEELKFQRTKAQTARILAIIGEQIYNFTDQLSRTLASIDQPPTKSQEELLLKIPCKDSQLYADLCQKALDLLQRARQRLGDEDTLK